MQRSGRMGPEMKQWVGSLAFSSPPSAVLACAVEPAKLRTPEHHFSWIRCCCGSSCAFGEGRASTCCFGQGAGSGGSRGGSGQGAP